MKTSKDSEGSSEEMDVSEHEDNSDLGSIHQSQKSKSAGEFI
jgi:hypothetical protein